MSWPAIHPVSPMPNPDTYESAMSLLTLAIGALERHPPETAADAHRVSLAATRLETLVNKQVRRLENVG